MFDKKVIGKWVSAINEGATILVKNGEKVDCGQVLAKSADKIKVEFDIDDDGAKHIVDMIGQQVKKGELAASWGGLFNKSKVFWPIDGEYVGLNDQGKAEFLIDNPEKYELKSPVAGNAIVKSDKVGVEFVGKEVGVKEIMGGKLWANGLTLVENWQKISREIEGKLGLIKNADEVTVAKAAALGLGGMITTLDDKIETALPIVQVTTEVFDKLVTMVDKDLKIWMNTGKGRLLIVKENENN